MSGEIIGLKGVKIPDLQETTEVRDSNYMILVDEETGRTYKVKREHIKAQKTSELVDDVGFLRAIPGEYMTESEVKELTDAEIAQIDGEIAQIREVLNTWEAFKNTGGVISNFLNVDGNYQELKLQNNNKTLMNKIDDTKGGIIGYFSNSGVEKSSITFNNNNEIDLKTQGINLTSPLYIKEGLSRNEPNLSEYSRIVRAATDTAKGSFKIQLGTDGGGFEVVNSDWNNCLFSVNEEDGVKISGDVYIGNQSLSTNGFTKLTNGLIVQWGKFNVNCGYKMSIKTDITLPITFPNRVFFQSAICSYNSSANDYSWTSAVLNSAISIGKNMLRIETRGIASEMSEHVFEINYFIVGF